MPRQDYRRHGVTMALAMLTAVAACSDSALPSGPHAPLAPAAPAGPTATRDGTWAGFTAEGNPVKFTIDAGVVKDLSIVVPLTGDCDIGLYQAFVNAAVDAFVVPIRLGDGTSTELSITAQFNDDNSTVAGGASLNYVGTLADGSACNSTGATTWTAMRNY